MMNLIGNKVSQIILNPGRSSTLEYMRSYKTIDQTKNEKGTGLVVYLMNRQNTVYIREKEDSSEKMVSTRRRSKKISQQEEKFTP
jgi:hypothetical protein